MAIPLRYGANTRSPSPGYVVGRGLNGGVPVSTGLSPVAQNVLARGAARAGMASPGGGYTVPGKDFWQNDPRNPNRARSSGMWAPGVVGGRRQVGATPTPAGQPPPPGFPPTSNIYGGTVGNTAARLPNGLPAPIAGEAPVLSRRPMLAVGSLLARMRQPF